MDQVFQTSDSGEHSTGDRSTIASALQNVGDAVVVISADSSILWADDRFSKLPMVAQDRCRQWCATVDAQADRTHLEAAGRYWEVILRRDANELACCILLETTGNRTKQLRLEAVEAAGLMLLHFNRDEIRHMTVADRLRLLEQRIIESVRRELKFDHFEIRLRSPGTDRLELVISQNLSPLRIGEFIHASETDNGISGWVAATGKSYVCGDVQKDPLYREGLDNARSSLTVPLMLHGKVIGVFNIESDTVGVFDTDDCIAAERYGEYIASVLHMLDLLVVERTTTREQSARNIESELESPLDSLHQLAVDLRDRKLTDEAERLAKIGGEIRSRVDACASGPRSIIDAEHELHSLQVDPNLEGCLVLVVDDEERIRGETTQVLEQLGCVVRTAASGTEAFIAIEEAGSGHAFDLVLSDIKLPDATGYEVFTKAREILPNVPVVLMTGFGYDPNHTIIRASADGVQGILLKPFRTEHFVQAIRNALLRDSAQSP